jgi:hypothetical protein
MVRLAYGVKGAPSTDWFPVFTQPGHLASAFGVAYLLWPGCRDELLVDFNAWNYDLYFSWLLLRLDL